MITVEIRFVNGAYQEFTVPESIIDRLYALRRNGVEGKDLVHSLLSDDWVPPPRTVKFVGTLADGKRVEESIVYQ